MTQATVEQVEIQLLDCCFQLEILQEQWQKAQFSLASTVAQQHRSFEDADAETWD